MKKVVVGTFISGFLMLVLACGFHVSKMMQTTSYTINTNNIKTLIGHINHSISSINTNKKLKRINKSIVVSNELSLKEFELKPVVEEKISKTNWAELFVPIQVEEKLDVKLAGNSQTKNNENKFDNRLVNEDRISIAQSATEKSNQVMQKNDSFKKSKFTEAKKNDLVFYDYSKKKSVKKSKVEKVANAYKNLLNSKKGSTDFDLSGFHKALQKSPKIANNKKSENFSASKMTEYSKGFNGGKHKSEYSFSVYSVDMWKMTTQEQKSFEVRFNDDIDEIYQSDSDGLISLQYTLNNEIGVRRGTIYSKGHYPLGVDFTLESNPVSVSLPLIQKEAFDNLLKQSSIKGLGGHILVELSEKTEDVEIDAATKYEEKVYLDKKFRVVERDDSDFYYILFIGVNPGNTIINFKVLDGQIISKIIHIKDEEIYYEPNYYVNKAKDEFSIFEENLLGKKITSLNIHEDEFDSFSNDNLVEKLGLNRAKITNAVYPLGTRKYHAVSHLGEPVIIGRWNSDYVELPSEEYMGFVLKQFNEVDVSYKCMVQLNLTKPAKELVYNGTAHRGMNVSGLILDKDGQFYNDLSLESNRVFLLGENQGTINIKIKYTDNSEDFIQSYCSESTYLVEQL